MVFGFARVLFIVRRRQRWKTTGQRTQSRVEIFGHSRQILTKTQAFLWLRLSITSFHRWSLISRSWALRYWPSMKWPSGSGPWGIVLIGRGVTRDMVLSWPVHVDRYVDYVALTFSKGRNTTRRGERRNWQREEEAAFNKGENHTEEAFSQQPLSLSH